MYTKRKRITYFAVALLLFAICLQVVTVSEGKPSDNLQVQIDGIKTTISNIQTQITDIQTQINNIQLIPGPQGEKGDTGPMGPAGPQGEKGDTGAAGSQVLVLTGMVKNNDLISIPDGYTIDQCNVVLGLTIGRADNVQNMVRTFDSAYKYGYYGILTSCTQTTDKSAYVVSIKHYDASSISTAPAIDNEDIELGYMMVCVK